MRLRDYRLYSFIRGHEHEAPITTIIACCEE